MITRSEDSLLDLRSPRAAKRARQAHLIGAAGCGMRSLAQVLCQAGWRLSQSDAAWTAKRLPAAADAVHDDLDLVVFSDAVPKHDAERRRAEQLGLRSLSYPAALGELMSSRRGLAVAGTHGKSTTAAMIGEILEGAGLDPSYIYGATRQDHRSGGRLGSGDWLVAEACEYRANFLQLCPEIAILLEIEPDHFDCYRTSAELEHAFERFVSRVPAEGLLLYAAANRVCQRIAQASECRRESLAIDAAADWQAIIQSHERGRYTFQVRYAGNVLGRVQLPVPGIHNVQNALAAAAAAWHAGADWPAIQSGLAAFGGLSRRLETVLDTDAVAIVDDYAHLPAEVVAGLSAVREVYPWRRVWCVFQPHQVSRTRALLDEFARSLQNADQVVVADVFRAREPAALKAEITAAQLAERVAALGGSVAPLRSPPQIIEHLLAGLQPRDVIVTMGAGNIGKIAHGIAERIRKNHTPE